LSIDWLSDNLFCALLHDRDKRTTSKGDWQMLKGLGGLGDMAKMMKQAQEMQGKMADAQAKLEELITTGEAGAGMVTVTVTAKGDVKGIQIDPALFVPSDKEVVEDLIVAAIKDGQAKAAQMQREEMGKITEGLNLPEGMKLPF
jgi:DNA-binding YbaB/EbfC family protein